LEEFRQMNKGTLTLIALAALAFAGCRSEPAVQPETAPVGEAAAVDPITLVRNGKMPMEGVLTGGQPTDEQLVALADAGFTTVINLRQPNERGAKGEAEKVAELGMAYVSIPVDGKAGLTEENAAALATALEGAERPLLLHCGSGNRVGALLAIKAFRLDGASAEEALEVGLAGGVTRLEPAVRELLGLVE
jgi:uncharacterized protein (TIGR01244 family)